MEAIRIASESDLPKLPAIEQSADVLFEEAGIKDLPQTADESELANAKCVLVIGNPPKGFARLDEIDGNAHLEQLSVDRGSMGQGLGSQLLESASAWAKDNGYQRMTLVTFKDVAWNAPFYAKHEFTELSDLSDGLLELREHEKELGLDDIGKRVVMYKDLN